MSADLAAFLLARIAEDEAVAQAATPGPWEWSEGGCGSESRDVLTATYNDSAVDATAEDKAHIARWDPARVLAECEARRRIVEEHAPTENDPADARMLPGYCRMCVGKAGWPIKEGQMGLGVKAPCPTLRLLALPFSSHPDYAPSWRP